MSKIALTPDASGTGTFTIAAPNSSTNRTLTLPDGSGTLATAESTLSQFNATGDAPVYACRAWVNFNGTGTVAIRASGNVSSITDNGTGDYTVNFATAMPDANYSWSGNAQTNNIVVTGDSTAQTTTQLFIATAGATNAAKFDETSVTVAVFR